MYIIYSNNISTKEIIPRAKFSSRKMARINLLKEAQNWLLNYKTPEGHWEIITHKFEAKDRSTKYYIKRSDKNEDVLSIYEQCEIKKEGWIYNSVEKRVQKIILFCIMEVPMESETIEPSSYILPMSVKDADPELHKAIDCKRSMITDLKTVLATRQKIE